MLPGIQEIKVEAAKMGRADQRAARLADPFSPRARVCLAEQIPFLNDALDSYPQTEQVLRSNQI